MMKTVNVLILGVGGNVSMGILTALRLSKIPCRLVGACIGPESLGLYYCDTAYVAPYAADEKFVSWVADICNKEKIDIIFTGVEENVIALEAGRQYLEGHTDAIFVASDYEHLQIGQNKYATAKWLKDNGCNYPMFANLSDEKAVNELIKSIGFPLIAKPNLGKGASGLFVAHSVDDLLPVQGQDYCLQQLLGDNKSEYTIACYVDKHGVQQDMIMMHRALKHGTTFMAEICHDDLIEQECRKICNAFKPKGPLNIQLRLNEGKPVCFELNVRFSGTTPIRARWGYNDVEMMIREYLFDEPVHFTPQKEGKVYRYYNEAFIDIPMQQKLASEGFVENCNIYNNTLNLFK